MTALSPTLKPRNAAAWHEWLAKHHGSHRGIFVVLAKKHVLSRAPGRLTYEQAVDEALCFGWIDGLTKRVDEDWRAIRFSPRRDDSVWSELNKGRVARLIREKKMTKHGMRLVDIAKGNGEWEKARRREARRVPLDLRAALDVDAAALWSTLAPSQQKMLLYWVTNAKKPETRARRVAAVVAACGAHRKPVSRKWPATQRSQRAAAERATDVASDERRSTGRGAGTAGKYSISSKRNSP